MCQAYSLLTWTPWRKHHHPILQMQGLRPEIIRKGLSETTQLVNGRVGTGVQGLSLQVRAPILAPLAGLRWLTELGAA